MLLDKLIPVYDVVEQHRTVVRARGTGRRARGQVLDAARRALRGSVGRPLPGWSTAGVRAHRLELHRGAQSGRGNRVPHGNARAKFEAYWLVVRLGSGLIRRAMLRAIRHEAEHQVGQGMR